MTAPLDAECIQQFKEAFKLEDPTLTQSILSYSFAYNNEWKLHAWKQLFDIFALSSGHFVLHLNSVREFGSSLFRKCNTLHMIPEQTLGDVTRHFINTRSLLLYDSVLAHESNVWDSNCLIASWKARYKLTPFRPILVERQSSSGFLSGASLAFARLSRWLWAEADDVSVDPLRYETSEASSRLAQKSEAPYFVTEERLLPYVEPLSQHSIETHRKVIYVPFLEKLTEKFFRELQTGSLRQANLLSDDTLWPSDNAPPDMNKEPCAGCVIPFSSLVTYIQKEMHDSAVSSEDVAIFLWFLCFLSSARVQPFTCNSNFDSPATSTTNNCEHTDLSHTGTFKGVKIVFPSRNEDPTQHAQQWVITPEDQGADLVQYAVLLYRLLYFRLKEAANECEQHLKSQRREAALLWLKRKKLFETEINSLNNQLLKIDEARHMRLSSKSLGMVVQVLHSTVKVAKASTLTESGQKESLETLLKEYQESSESVRHAQTLLQKAVDQDSMDITTESLIEEYDQLLLQLQDQQKQQEDQQKQQGDQQDVSVPERTESRPNEVPSKEEDYPVSQSPKTSYPESVFGTDDTRVPVLEEA